jgi:hypothetical protein
MNFQVHFLIKFYEPQTYGTQIRRKKIYKWLGVFQSGNEDGVNSYPTRKMVGRVKLLVDSFFFFFFFKENFFLVFLHFFFFFCFSTQYYYVRNLNIMRVCFLNGLEFDYYESTDKTNFFFFN